MQSLTRELPNSIALSTRQIEIKTDFKTWLNFQSQMAKNISELERIQVVKSVFFEDVKIMPNEYQDVLFGISEYLKGARGYINHVADVSKTINNDIPFDFELDSSYIYGAFMEQYGIDLFDAELHYYKFMALFECLHENTAFKKIVGYRMTDTRKIKDKNMRAHAEKMKRLYEIIDTQAQEDFEAEKQQILSDWG